MKIGDKVNTKFGGPGTIIETTTTLNGKEGWVVFLDSDLIVYDPEAQRHKSTHERRLVCGQNELTTME